MLTLINPVPRADPFDHADWLFELKFDGFRAAPTPMPRFESVLALLPKGHVFDGELPCPEWER
jgi:hypothetical protein